MGRNFGSWRELQNARRSGRGDYGRRYEQGDARGCLLNSMRGCAGLRGGSEDAHFPAVPACVS